MDKLKKKSSFNIIIVIIGMTLIAKVIGLLRDTLISHNLGAGVESDVYFMGLAVTTIIFLGIGSAISTNIIPIIVKDKKDHGAANSISSIFNIVVLGSIILGVTYFIAAPSIVKLFATGYNTEKLAMTVQVTRIMIPTIILICTTYFFVGVLQANEKFLLPAIISFPYNILFFVYITFGIGMYGIKGLAAVTTLGWLLQLGFLVPSIIKHKLMPFSFKLDFKDKVLRSFFIGILPIILVTLTHQFNIMMDNKAASFLGDGSVSSIYYGNMLFTAIVTTTVYGITAVMFPKFNKRFLEDNYEGLFQSVVNVLRSVLILLIPMSVGLVLVGPHIISLIFERGVFDASDTITTVIAFTGYTSFMLAFGFIEVLNKAYYTLNIKWIPLLISGFIVVINVILNQLLVKDFGFSGIVMGTSVAFYSGALLSLIIFIRRNKVYSMSRFYNTLIKSLIAAMAMGAGVYAVNNVLVTGIEKGELSSIIIIIVDITVGVIIYGITLLLVKEQLISHGVKQLKKRFIRS